MNRLWMFAIILTVPAFSVSGQTCVDSEELARLDGEWEKALLESDTDRLAAMLADDFVWVHNHASSIDTKSSLLERSADPAVGATGGARSRVSSDVAVRVLGTTGVVTGFTVVDREESSVSLYISPLILCIISDASYG